MYSFLQPTGSRLGHGLRRSLLVAAAVLVPAWPGAAEGASPFVYTVGNSYPVSGGTHAYLLWHPADATTTFGKRFAIYRKDGNAGSANPYEHLSIQTVQTAPAAVQALLKVGQKFDANASLLPERINLLYTDATTQPDEIIAPPPTDINLEIATQFGHLLQIAEGDAQILNRLLLLGRAHPGAMIALGHAFAIKVSPTALQTYEVREIDAGGNVLHVVGRVTLDAANPTALPAPGRPLQVLHPAPPDITATVASAKDHLACRFRWSTPVPLRRLVPHTFGYNLYRVRESVAITLGWDVGAPDIADLEALVAVSAGPDPDAKRVNTLPVIANKILTDAEAGDPTDQETFFTHDDNEPPDNPFQDGDTYYYFTAARDIAGHPGAASLGTRITYCDRLPPTVPMIEAVSNVFTAPPTPAELVQLKGTQHFRIRIRQVPETPIKDAASTYYIYRWDYAQEALLLGGNPAVNLVGSVAHVPGETYVDWQDTGATAPKITPADSTTWAGKVVWYTVRAEDNTACNPKNLSSHSPPAFGVLRDRVGPGRPGGEITRCRALPITDTGTVREESKRSLGLPDNTVGFVVEVERTDAMIQSFDIQVTQPGSTSPDYTATHFFTSSDLRRVLVPLAEEDGTLILVRCRTQTAQVSNWATQTAVGPPQSSLQINVYDFNCSVQARYTPTPRVPPGESPPEHETVGPGGVIVGPSGVIILPAGTKEWRVYRRVLPDGERLLIARGSGDFVPNQNVNWTDPAPPTANDTEVCYYYQVFDENSNAGPLTEIECLKFVNGNLGTPMLMEPELLAEQGGQAQLRLKWFCDPVGIHRFEIWIAEDGGGDPQVSSPKISPKLGTIDGTVISQDTAGLSFCGFQTQTIDGSTAEFSVDLIVQTGKEYTFGVRGVGSGAFNTRCTGSFSNIVAGLWKEPDAPNQPVVPWPDRALPIIQDLGYDIADCRKGEGPFYAQPLPPSSPHGSAVILMGIYKTLTSGQDTQTETLLFPGTEPLDMFFKFRKQGNPKTPFAELTPIYPFVVYRHQVPGGSIPNPVPNLVQCSPLIDRLAYKTNPGSIEVRDPFFLYVSFFNNPDSLVVPSAGNFTRDNNFLTIQPDVGSGIRYLGDCDAMLLWKDHVPAVAGGSYQDPIVRFDELGEIERVIPTNVVNH